MNPFDDPDAEFLVLVNHEGQYSLWPTFADVPEGWTVDHDKDAREACLAPYRGELDGYAAQEPGRGDGRLNVDWWPPLKAA
ncbi:uncharacterized protein YbdZ (MbtH family) [Streptomyces rapamycinicus]|uniref:Protein mbtH n=2 Tax=Streptomyces rapamycinicus TaxID=1226757 RepID=A0A3L8R978_STRRN|nr:uncharacterized protein YbdZ (MbtH family) [Streptomyces rapamycinicus]RLV76231.1 protein mbtH [Streptomyces rapamycinicus NRRL 5491]